MKVWIVLYMTGKLVAAWDSNYDTDSMSRCRTEADKLNDTMVIRGSEIEFTCMESDKEPVLNAKLSELHLQAKIKPKIESKSKSKRKLIPNSGY